MAMRKNWPLFFLFGIVLLLSLGCIDKITQKIDKIQKIDLGTKTEKTQQTKEEKADLPTGPRMCITQYPSTGTVETSYDDGAERMRIETRTRDNNDVLVVVLKEGYALTGVMGGSSLKEKYPNCDWVATPADIKSVRKGAESVAEVYKNEPDFRFTCTPWVVEERMFETPGKVCFGR